MITKMNQPQGKLAPSMGVGYNHPRKNGGALNNSLNSKKKGASSSASDGPSYNKWKKRLQREEVFHQYYFPAKWETHELNFLIQLFDLQDPCGVNPMKKGSRNSSITGVGSSNLLGKSIQLGAGGGVGNSNLKHSGGSGGNADGRRKATRRKSQSLMGGNNVFGGGGGGSATEGGREGGGSKNSSANSTFLGGLSASIAQSFQGGSSPNMAQLLLTDTSKKEVDPAKITKQSIDYIFFPYVHDPKSVLLKCGTVILKENTPNKKNTILRGRSASIEEEIVSKTTDTADANKIVKNCPIDPEGERELLLFTQGFVVADIVSNDAFKLFLTLGDKDFTEMSFVAFLKVKFKEMGVLGDTGIDKQQLLQIFRNLGIPKSESVLNEIMRMDNTKTPSSGKVDCEAFLKSLKVFLARCSSSGDKSSSNDNSAGGNASDRGESGGSENPGVKKWFGIFQKDDVKTTSKVESAFCFASVTCVECLDLNTTNESSRKDDTITTIRHPESSFAVTVMERKHSPLIFTCSKEEYRDAWVNDAFPNCVIRALSKSKDPEVVEIRSKVGWQHSVIRSSYSSLVIMNDANALKQVLRRDKEMTPKPHKRWEDLDAIDTYNGFSALHYATILGHVKCMEVLLQAGAKVDTEDRNGFSPMYHALKNRNDETTGVLEKYGADLNKYLKRLIEDEIRQQEEEAATKTSDDKNDKSSKSVYNSTRAFMEDTTRALNGWSGGGQEEEEDLDELLMKAVNQFGGM